MNVTLSVPDHVPGGPLRFSWDDGYEIAVDRAGGEVVIRANAAGLVSLARHCLTLAQQTVPPGSHIHLSDVGELEDGSGELIIERGP